jgi:DNA-binding NtrC family response regulator
MQAQLLRTLQDGEVRPVGGSEAIRVDVRIVCATNKDLDAEVKAGRFREDLYFRINVVSITLPPLRERVEDIPLLVEHFLRKYEHETGLRAPRTTPEAMERLCSYGWPGNVRELENVIERAMLMSTQGQITPDALPPRITRQPPSPELIPLSELIERYVAQVLEHTRGNRSRAAKILGISRRTLHRMEKRKRVSAEMSDSLSHEASE